MTPPIEEEDYNNEVINLKKRNYEEMISNPIDGDIELDHKDQLIMGSKRDGTSKQGIYLSFI